MSTKRFLETLQALLNMVDGDDPHSVARLYSILDDMFAIARVSGKCNPQTLRVMDMAQNRLTLLIKYRDDFACRPHDASGNLARRQRLEQMLTPGC